MQKLSVLFCGDFAPCDRFEDVTLKKGAEVFGALREDISDADISFLNLEAPLCAPGHQINKAGPAIRADPDCIRAVSQAGFTVAGLANNHIMDYGSDGLTSTIEACESHGVRHCGAGSDLARSQRPVILQAGDVKVAILAFAEREFSIAGVHSPGAAPLDVIENVRQIEEAKSLGHIVVVTVHGGNEYFRYPRPGLRRLCRFYIDIGVHAVICHHPHVAGTFEIYKERPIFYSLGNLVFDHMKPPPGWNDGYAVKLTFAASNGCVQVIGQEIIPYEQSLEAGGVRKLSQGRREAYLEDLEQMRDLLADEDRWLSEWEVFCKSREKPALLRQYLPFIFPGAGRLTKLVPLLDWLVPKSSVSAKLNTLRCDSHREVLTHLLENRL